jgi:AcrR family transcriptional regulator
MSKGDETRQVILGHALELARVEGLAGVTIGRLAETASLSKSGLFAHFGSKEALDVAVVEEASRRFVQEVLVPALARPRGEPRVKALVDNWMAWGMRAGDCFFVSTTAELDDKPGPARDALVRATRDWIDALATAARIAVDEGHFRADLDPQLFAFQLYGVMLAAHLFGRFLAEPGTRKRASAAVEALMASARRPR